jgi:hypothetical protein
VADPRVGIVLVSWNGRAETLACLASLAAATYPALVPIVVDNGSSDGILKALADGYPTVERLRSETNLGFAGGANVGIARALELGVDYVLMLNNDVEVDPGFVEPLVAEAQQRPQAGALCPKILYLDPPDVIWFAGARFDPRAGYHGRQRGHGERDDGRFDAVVETDRACGGAMLVARAVIEQVGVFDPELFAYSEDTDWSLRARRAGYRHYVVPASRVWHKVSVASGGENAPATIYYDVRNSLEVSERYAPLGPVASARRRGVVVATHAAQALLSRRPRAGLAAVVEGLRDQRAGRFGQRRSR